MQFISNCPIETVRITLIRQSDKNTVVRVQYPNTGANGLDVQIVGGVRWLGMIINLLPPRVQFRGKLFTIDNNQTMLEGEIIHNYKLYQRFWNYILFFISMIVISGFLIHPYAAIFVLVIAYFVIGGALIEWLDKVRGFNKYVDKINNALAETFEKDCS